MHSVELDARSDVAAGAIGGLAGATVMTVAMVAGKRSGVVERPLPIRMEQWARGRLGGRDEPGPADWAAAFAAHQLYGAVLGSAYGLLGRFLPGRPVPAGPAYGLLLYAVNLGGVLPALGVTRGPTNEDRSTAARRAAMHAVYGTVTALVFERTRRVLEP